MPPMGAPSASLLDQGADALRRLIWSIRCRAGCDDPDILAHCRGPGPYVRGCWVVDLLLGKG
jgi:hypothetical protein